MKNQKGFMLIELILASMLSGMIFLAAFPLVFTGYGAVKKERIRMEAAMIGDSIFERISKENQNTEEICSEFMDFGFDVEIESEPVDNQWISLTVILVKEGDYVYERSEFVPLFN